MFSVQFLFTKQYQLKAGADINASFFHKMTSPILLILALFIYNGFRFEFASYSLILALLNGIIMVSISIFSIRALSKGSISNYSLYLLSGGMVLPVIYGAFTGDSFGGFKITSILIILIGVFIKYDKKEKVNFSAYTCFFMLFILNGLVGIVSSLHQRNPFSFSTVSPIGFSMLSCSFAMVLGATFFIIYRTLSKSQKPPVINYIKASPYAIIDGLINGIANLLLLIALLKIEPSAQYPIVTGGCIFLSALFSFIIYKEKPSKKEIISITCAIIGSILIIF
jgi:drug/metabolite transporter (DMT)-like permease